MQPNAPRHLVARALAQFGLLAGVVVFACMVGCAGASPSRPEPTPEPEPVAPVLVAEPIASEPVVAPYIYEDTQQTGRVCRQNSDCDARDPNANQCRGLAGCEHSFACGPRRECGTENIAYCGCDGVTFYALRDCPERGFSHPGPCLPFGQDESVEFGLPAGDEPITTQDRTCRQTSDCRRGEICFGNPGCGAPFRCRRVNGCSRNTAQFCSCDGTDFVANASCPGQPYSYRGACGAADGNRSSQASAMASGTRTVPSPPRVPTPGQSTGRTCLTQRDCQGGEICSGAEGCGEAWTCQRPSGPCIPDTQRFCGCDGQTFRASMTCPNRKFAHRGSCQ